MKVLGATINLDENKALLLDRYQLLFIVLVMSALLAGLSWMGMLGPWGLLGFTFAIGCGGGESSYQDRQGDIDPETVDNQPPADMADEPSS